MIRAMQLEDIKVVACLEEQIFSSNWKEKDFLYELNDNEFANYYVYELDGKIIGYYGLWTLFEQAQITTIAISQEYRGHHYGDELLADLINKAIQNQCEFLSLEVRISNEKAINLYKKHGFEIVNIRKGYYQDNNEDAYLMVKAIGGL